MKLRPYQAECLAAVKAEYLAGVNRQLVVCPTASGKSVIFRAIPQIFPNTGKQTWLLVHKIELVSQAAKHFRQANPDLKVGIERDKDYADLDCDVIVASIQTIGKTGGGYNKRLQRFDPTLLGQMIIDEAHHCTSEIFRNVLEYFGLLKDKANHSKALLLGVTATPNRTDKIGLGAIFDEIVFRRDIRQMIDDGWLSKITPFRAETTVDISKVKIHAGDFAVKQLEDVVNTPERNAIIIEKYKEVGNGRPAIAFTVSVRHSHDLAMAFRQAGISALPFSGQTPEKERERLFPAHQSGEVKVLVSCSALGEGVDLPWAEVGLIAKPTKSDLLYTQILGRMLRPYPAPEEVALGAPVIKKSAIIVDFVDVCLKRKLCSVPSLFGLRNDFNLKGKSVTDALQEIESAKEKFKQLKLDSFADLDQLNSILLTIDLFKPPEIPEILRGISTLAWTDAPGDSYQLIGPSTHLTVRPNQLGQFDLSKHETGTRRIIRTFAILKQAIQEAERMVPGQDMALLRSEAKWRMEKPSPKQIGLLARLKPQLFQKFGRNMGTFSVFCHSTYSKGEISSLISEAMGARR